MMKKIIYFIVILFLLEGCKKTQNNGGVIFTFDDQSIEEWFSYKDVFKKYKIKATFFITRPQLLDSNLIRKLKILESDGHEIACHGYNHISVFNYKDTSDLYINNEILPSIKTLHSMGFKVVSFAYPFGDSTPTMDSLLLKYFKYIRKATYNINNTTINNYDNIYANKNSYYIVNAMGIDYNDKISLKNFETGIKRAISNNEILILYAHSIDTIKGDFIIQSEYLEKLFAICKKNKIKSLTMKDMDKFYSK